LTNKILPSTDGNAIIAIDDSLMIRGGSAWAVGGNSISFVSSTQAVYNQNNPIVAMNAFMSGTPVTVADPSSGAGIYIFKIVEGSNGGDVYYGMLKVTDLVPATSISYEYKIGNTYTQIPFIK
jgi:hypothetical protein